jgi:type II secretory pathway pseudopilin PulG
MMNKKGFTLIELLLYVSLSGIILFTASGILTTLFEVRQKDRVIQEVEEQGILVSYTIDSYIKNAQTVTLPVQYFKSDHLNLYRYTETTSGSVDLYVKDGQIVVKEGSGNPTSLTSKQVVVSDLSFHNTGVPNTRGFINYTFTVLSQDVSGRIAYKKVFSGGAAVH